MTRELTLACRVVGQVLGPVRGSLHHAVHCFGLPAAQAQLLLGLSGLCIPGVFITYVMLKNQKVTKKAQ